MTASDAKGHAPRRAVAKVGMQVGAGRRSNWTRAQEAAFLETLAESCNVSEAARAAGKSLSGAYARKQREPAFAQAWQAALEVGYGELETLLLRELLFGSEQEDIMLDGEGAVKSRKVKRSRNLGVAMRLMLHHAEMMEKIRANQRQDRPDSADAVARMHKVLDAVRKRREALGE